MKNPFFLPENVNDIEPVSSMETGPEPYAFMWMYEALSRRRICMPLLFPLLSVLALVISFSVLSRGAISRSFVLEMFTHPSIQLAFFPAVVIPILISFTLYCSNHRNLDMLRRVYDTCRTEEQLAIDAIKKSDASYVFTSFFLLNWDGGLTIIPLKEIEQIEYVRYFYFFLNGTKLRIRANKTYVIWAHGPAGSEWVARGFSLPSEQSEKKVSYEVNLPM